MMSLRLRFWLPPASLAVLGGSLGILAWSIWTPCDVEVPSEHGGTVAASAPVDEPARLSLRDFEPLFGRRFQTPLYDPPPPEPPPPKPEKPIPPPPVKLLATMPEPGGGYAMFSDQGNNVLLKRIGEIIPGGNSPAELMEIATDHVVLKYEGRMITLAAGRE